MDQRKAQEHELATFHENRRAVGMLNPTRDQNEVTYRGGEEMTPVTTACPETAEGKASCELSWKVKMMINTYFGV